MARERDLSDWDVFARPVLLRFKGITHFKSSVGGLLTVLYCIIAAFLLCVCAKALVVGFYLNAASTTYNLIQSEASFKEPLIISDNNLRFGFTNPPTLLSAYTETWQPLATNVGRFELLRIERNEEAVISYERIPIESCEDNGSSYCIEKDREVTVYGDPYASKYAVLALQVRPCQTFK